MDLDAQTRRFLEQMMMRFVALGVPVEQGAHELVEIEAHIYESEVDPFDEFGDPQVFATTLIPLDERHELYRQGLRRDLTIGVLAGLAAGAAVQFVLTLFGTAVTSVPKLVVMATLFGLWGAGQLAFARILTGVADDDQSLRLRGAALVCLAAFMAAITFSGLLALAGADFTGTEPFQVAAGVWFAAAATIMAGTAALAYRTWKLNRPSEALIEGGVTGQIIYEMNHNGFIEGWVQYGPNGEDLRDPDYSIVGNLRDTIRNSGGNG